MPLTDLHKLRDSLADLAVLGDTPPKEPTAEPPQQASQYDGEAEGRALWLSVDPRGLLISVDVSTSWRQRLAPEQFADALFAAYQSAVRKALTAQLSVPRRAPSAPVPQSPPADDSDFFTWLDGFLARARERRAQAATFADLDTVREVRSPAGYLTLRLRGGVLDGITGSAAGLKSANPNMLRQDLLDVFREANLTADR